MRLAGVPWRGGWQCGSLPSDWSALIRAMHRRAGPSVWRARAARPSGERTEEIPPGDGRAARRARSRSCGAVAARWRCGCRRWRCRGNADIPGRAWCEAAAESTDRRARPPVASCAAEIVDGSRKTAVAVHSLGRWRWVPAEVRSVGRARPHRRRLGVFGARDLVAAVGGSPGCPDSGCSASTRRHPQDQAGRFLVIAAEAGRESTGRAGLASRWSDRTNAELERGRSDRTAPSAPTERRHGRQNPGRVPRGTPRTKPEAYVPRGTRLSPGEARLVPRGTSSRPLRSPLVHSVPRCR